jgi:glyoxylase-like metal-dependent hydrolase (beta-lactamase superfamily II)/rhodanese-related sulfurtransferase
VDFELFVTPGLGDNSYLLTSGGEAALIDPQRDAWRFLEAAERLNTRVRYVFETHVHNDYISGACEARAANGADIVAPARGGYAFDYAAAEEGAEFRLGALRIVALETPGHTPEHISWLVYEDGNEAPAALFSGGSLLVGSAGRTDLLGAAHTDELTRSQFRTMRRLAELPDSLQVLPTHGAGSFCASSAPAMTRVTTIGEERMRNVALTETEEPAFMRRQLSGLLSYPKYYAHMAPINRTGPAILHRQPAVPALMPEDVAGHSSRRAWILDTRSRFEFAKKHIPGSLNIELNSSFGTYAGWLLPFDDPLVLVLPDPGEHATMHDAVLQLARIGFDRVLGYLDGGIDAWESSGRKLQSYETCDIDDVCHVILSGEDPYLLDVRQQNEWDAGHVPGSQHIFIGELMERISEVPSDRTIWIACASGYRAAMAASILAREGRKVRLMAHSGVPEWLARCFPAEMGSGAPAPV